MSQIHGKQIPNESDSYRSARDKLLQLEIELRSKVAEVANHRMALPDGGKLKEDYVFEEGPEDLSDTHNVQTTKFSELFRIGKDTLFIYSFMYPPDGNPCPMCTSFLDSLNANAPYIEDRISVAVIAKSPIVDIRNWARGRGWDNLRLLSSGGNSYNLDYHAETKDGEQIPMVNVFRRTEDGISHFWASELFFVPAEEGMHSRHVDQFWPLWNVLDLAPEGRGADWFPDPNMA